MWPPGLSERMQNGSTGMSSLLDDATLTTFVIHCCRNFDKIFLIFDALDECGDLAARCKLLEFTETVRQAVSGTSIFLTSRPQRWLNGGLHSPNAKVIYIEAQPCDLEAYIRAKTEHINYGASLVNEIITKLIQNSQGMSFLLIVYG
jgi:hypothetical protein